MGTGVSANGQSQKVTDDGIPGDNPLMAYTEQLLEEKEQQLRKYIQENYSKIRDVERELANLTLELKLTAGPKKAALEHLRKKIEFSTEKIKVAKQKEEQARKAWEVADKALKDEEANKQKLCEDLNRLVQESASAQYSRLEELKKRLEALSPVARGSPQDPADHSINAPSSSSPNISADGGEAIVPSAKASTQQPNVNTHCSGISENTSCPEPSSHSSVEDNSQKKVATKTHQTNQGRSQHVNRAKGSLVLAKAKGDGKGGWTGAGFDVDSKS